MQPGRPPGKPPAKACFEVKQAMEAKAPPSPLLAVTTAHPTAGSNSNQQGGDAGSPGQR